MMAAVSAKEGLPGEKPRGLTVVVPTHSFAKVIVTCLMRLCSNQSLP